MAAHEEIKKIVAFQEDVKAKVGKEKRVFESKDVPAEIADAVRAYGHDKLDAAVRCADKQQRDAQETEVREDVLAHFADIYPDNFCLLYTSWGADDILILRENLLLHKLKSIDYDSWADAQMLYSYQRYGTTQQYSVAHAMEDLHISSEELSAHNALHDAIFTAHICQKLDLPTALLHYDLSLIHI